VDDLLRTDPNAAAKLARLSAALAPLDADLEPDVPPEGLAVAALARTAEYLVENGLFTSSEGFVGEDSVITIVPNRTVRWLPFTRTHANAAVAASIAFFVVALGVVGVQKTRRQYQTAMCQNNLRELHGSLAGYSETHGGRFPQAGTDAAPLAGAFMDELTRSGQPVASAARRCPVYPATAIGYAYSLGFRDPLGRLVGLRKPESADDYTPILADLPTEEDQPTGHCGWNVLFVGGSVRFTTVSTIGVDGDDIFRNAVGLRRAGLFRDDVCLGRPFDQP
jgi:hypothetical protein